MVAVLIVLVVVLGSVAFWALRKSSKSSGAAPPSSAPRPQAPAIGGHPAPIAPPAAVPQPSAALVYDPRLIQIETLSDNSKLALLAELRSIPRPPRALHQLVSPALLGRASSAELSDLVMSEPVVAARVMAAVNSPLYGLRQTVTSVGQAITFLGLNSVRSMGLRYLLSEALPPGDAWLRKEFDTLWRASAIASELCLQLARRLQLPDAAGMATQLVLSSLGRFAVATLMRRAAGATADPADPAITQVDMVQRALTEQDKLGLSAGEIGYLLMQDWGLPESMVAETRDIGRILFTGTPTPDATRAARLALCGLCAAVAERIARGKLRICPLTIRSATPAKTMSRCVPIWIRGC